MKRTKRLWTISLVLITGMLNLPMLADDTVTIPKSRLEELERKEAELDKLKADADKKQPQSVPSENAQQGRPVEPELQKSKATTTAEAAAVAPATSMPVVAEHTTPPIPKLAPLEPGEIVDAMDLMSHYRNEAPEAAKRYESQRIQVQGEVVRFEKPVFVRPYLIYLKTANRDWKVECRVSPPETFSAVFTARGGDDLVGATSAGVRSVIARLGQMVVVKGRCKGLKDQTVRLTDCTLELVK